MAIRKTNKREALAAIEGNPINANGDFHNYGVGRNDVAVDFGEGTSFVDARIGDISIILDWTAVDSSYGSATIALIPAWYSLPNQITDPNGNVVGAIITDGAIGISSPTGGTDYPPASITTTNGTVRDFLEYIKENPTLIDGLRVTVSNQQRLSTPLWISRKVFGKSSSFSSIIPIDSVNGHQYNPLIVDIQGVESMDIVLSRNLLLITTMYPGEKTTITFNLAASVNNATELSRKSRMARANFITSSPDSVLLNN